MKKSQLKAFNKSDIEAGAELLRFNDEDAFIEKCTYIAGPDPAGEVVVMGDNDYLWIFDRSCLFIKPITELENRPVYPNSVFWLRDEEGIFQVKITSFKNTSIRIDEVVPFGLRTRISHTPIEELLKNCTWERPKKKMEGWVNIYMSGGIVDSLGGPHATKEVADQNASLDCRVDCVKITWEE